MARVDAPAAARCTDGRQLFRPLHWAVVVGTLFECPRRAGVAWTRVLWTFLWTGSDCGAGGAGTLQDGGERRGGRGGPLLLLGG